MFANLLLFWSPPWPSPTRAAAPDPYRSFLTLAGPDPRRGTVALVQAALDGPDPRRGTMALVQASSGPDPRRGTIAYVVHVAPAGYFLLNDDPTAGHLALSDSLTDWMLLDA